MPRLRQSTLHIQETEAIIGQLYPVLIDVDTGEILDGRERSKVNPDWRREVFSVPGETEEEKELNRLRIKHISNWARKNPDHIRDLTEIAERTGWRGIQPFVDFLGVPERTISRYLPQKFKNEVQSNNAQNPRMAATKATKKLEKAVKTLEDTVKAVEKTPIADEIKEEIASSVETTLNLFSEVLNVLPENTVSIENRIGIWLEEIEWEFSLWECQYERPEGFGDKTFHGNCSPSIITALLKRFSTVKDDFIFDPMAGSGTFIDVAKTLGYEENQIIARDIQPRRSDIEYGDAIETNLPDNSIDFVFAHFPYWKLIEYTDDNPRDASGFSYDEFIEWSEAVFVEIKRILKRKKFLAVMIGNLRDNGIIDLESGFSEIGRKHFKLWDKIIKRIRTWDPETRGQRMGLALARARQHGYTVVNHDTILVFRKG